jgi:large subunit ribosomal protein L31e
MAKKEKAQPTERTYTIPLRKAFSRVPIYRRTPRAVKAVREFLQRHMKSTTIHIGKRLNEELWKRGIRNPPHKVKVTVTKDENNIVKAELFGHALEEKVEKKEEKAKELHAKKDAVDEKKESPKEPEKETKNERQEDTKKEVKKGATKDTKTEDVQKKEKEAEKAAEDKEAEKK